MVDNDCKSCEIYEIIGDSLNYCFNASCPKNNWRNEPSEPLNDTDRAFKTIKDAAHKEGIITMDSSLRNSGFPFLTVEQPSTTYRNLYNALYDLKMAFIKIWEPILLPILNWINNLLGENSDKQ